MGEPIEGSMEKILARASSPPIDNSVTSSPTGNFQVNHMNDCWSISGVGYRNRIHTVDLAKSLLDNGSAKTQDDWASYSEASISQNGFRTPDYPLLYGIVKAIYMGRNDSTKAQEIGEAQKFLKDTSRAKWLMTLTRISYKSRGNDVVIHNFGTRDTYEELSDFIGPDGFITAASASPCKALLGTDDIQEIKDVFQWLNGTNTYLWRVNSKADTERIARFVADSGGAVLGCGGVPSYANSSLGVRLRAGGTAP